MKGWWHIEVSPSTFGVRSGTMACCVFVVGHSAPGQMLAWFALTAVSQTPGVGLHRFSWVIGSISNLSQQNFWAQSGV